MRKTSLLLTIAAAAMCCTSCLTRIVTVADSNTPVRYVAPGYTTQTYVSNTPVYTTTTVRVPAQRKTTTTTVQVSPVTSDISLYLDLQAVAAAFAQSNTVEEFETILNSYEYMISNLDLNGDGYVDYLRVMETMNGYNHLYVIQAVLAKNIYQDVATLVIEGGTSLYATPYVQVIGHPYIYGTNYIIEPVFVRRPPLFDRYRRYYYGYTCWQSPYYYGHFPPHYHYCAPRHYSHYHSYVTTYMTNHKYCHQVNYTEVHHYVHYVNDTKPVSKNDYATAHPEGSFNSRNTGVTYTPSGTTTQKAVTNTRQLQQTISASGASRTTTTSGSRGTTTSASTSSRQPATSTTTSTSGTTGSRTPASSTTTTTSRTPASSTTGSSSATTSRTPATSTVNTGSRTQTSVPATTSRTETAPAATSTPSVSRTGSSSTTSGSRGTSTSSSTSSRSKASSTTTTTSRVSTSGTARTTSRTEPTSETSSSSRGTSSTTSSSTSSRGGSSTSTTRR